MRHAYGSPIRLDLMWYTDDHPTHMEWVSDDCRPDIGMGMVPLGPGWREQQMVDLAHRMVANGHDGSGEIHLRRLNAAGLAF